MQQTVKLLFLMKINTKKGIKRYFQPHMETSDDYKREVGIFYGSFCHEYQREWNEADALAKALEFGLIYVAGIHYLYNICFVCFLATVLC